MQSLRIHTALQTGLTLSYPTAPWQFVFPAVVVFQANDIVLSQVVLALYFNIVYGFVERIRDPLHITDGDVGGLVDTKIEDVVVFDDTLLAAHDDPVLGTVRVLLQ